MRYMNGKAKMMVTGLAIGLVAATLVAVLAVKGQIGVWGVTAVILVAALAGSAGWMIGVQTRVRFEKHRVWLEGYMDGREEGQIAIRASCHQIILPYKGLGH